MEIERLTFQYEKEEDNFQTWFMVLLLLLIVETPFPEDYNDKELKRYADLLQNNKQ
jgi:hypothetical protein